MRKNSQKHLHNLKLRCTFASQYSNKTATCGLCIKHKQAAKVQEKQNKKMPSTKKKLSELSQTLRDTFDRIKDGLPYDYVQQVQERVKNKTGRRWSETYIKQVASEKNPRHNNDILEECIELISERNARTTQMLLNALHAENGSHKQTHNGNHYELTAAGWQLCIN